MSDLGERVGELVLSKVDVPGPKRGQILTETELVYPVFSVNRIRQVELTPAIKNITFVFGFALMIYIDGSIIGHYY